MRPDQGLLRYVVTLTGGVHSEVPMKFLRPLPKSVPSVKKQQKLEPAAPTCGTPAFQKRLQEQLGLSDEEFDGPLPGIEQLPQWLKRRR